MELIYLPNELRDIILLPKYYQNENLTLNEKVEICHNSQFMTNVISQLKYLRNEFEYLRNQKNNHWCKYSEKMFYKYAMFKNNQKLLHFFNLPSRFV